MNIESVKSSFFGRHIAVQSLLVSVVLVATGRCQQRSYEHTFHAAKPDVELALQKVRADSAAKLPLLEGFVAEVNHPQHYRRPYYQYSVQLTALNPSETLLRATANITAWYEDENPTNSAYRSLPSNGRLESDLFERVEEALQSRAAKAASPSPANIARADSQPEIPQPQNSELPDSASAAKVAALLRNPANISNARASTESAARDNANDKSTQALEEQARTLREILQNQSRPDDLGIVQHSRTPILSGPMPGAKVLLLADAEDEFQILSAEDEWVHVQLTGLQRGWIRRSQLDLSGVSPRLFAEKKTSAAAGDSVFQQTRQETGTFPGDWEALRGKKVRIIWVQPDESRRPADLLQREKFLKSVFRKSYPELAHSAEKLDGVVIVFDAADGGMAAATVADLRRLNAGELTDTAFWKRCWLDPPEAFKSSDR